MSCTNLKRMALVLEDLEPDLWGTLAPCLLDLVFLRLPVAQMSQLRLLSKLWKAAIDSVESEFNLLLEAKVYPNLFGLIGLKSPRSVPCVWMFDVNQDRWCVREIDRSVGGKYTMGAADGGLVCFVSTTTKAPLTIVVMNPLTGRKVELPHLLCIHDVVPTVQPSMLHLTMNRKNNQYVVLFVGYIQSGDENLLVQVYDSRTKEWSIVGSREKSWGCIIGCWYAWSNEVDSDNESRTNNGDCYDGRCLGPCLYDFAQEEVCHYDDEPEHDREPWPMSYAMFRDRYFVLCDDPPNLVEEGRKSKYYISEYHLRQNAAVWVKGGTHRCTPFDGYLYDEHYLRGCNGCLMVLAHNFGPIDEYLHVWLYNLSTYNWHVLPDIPGFDHFSREEDVLICELRWSATP